MGKFKVGDRVQVTDNNGAPRHYNVGDIGVVSNVYGFGEEMIQLEGRGAGMYAHRFELVEEKWVPKVGDRVRYKNQRYGEATVVEIVGNNHVKVDTHGVFKICTEHLTDLEPLAIPAPATLTIEAGKFYRTRDGRKVGPVAIAQGRGEPWPWKLASGSHYYREDGHSCPGYAIGHQDRDDLIALWQDDVVVPTTAPVTTANDNAAKPKFKVGDRVTKNYWDEDGYEVNAIDPHKIWLMPNSGGSSVFYSLTDPDLYLVSSPTTPTAIVALIENGQPKPSSVPHVHDSERAASIEAQRLADLHKGQRFGVFVLTASTETALPTYDHEWKNLAAKGEKISAIKSLRSITGMGLKPAKDAVEYFLDAA